MWQRSVSCLHLGVAALVVVTGADAAMAVSVANRDDKDHTLTVIEGDAKATHILKPAGVLDGVCLKGCIIRLGDSENDEYELEGSEVVSIEDGYLYYDGPETGQGSAPGASGQPAPATKP
jgi:hypothetical protein